MKNPPPGRFLETLTWDAAEPLLLANPVVVLPLGARLKEHGLHLPLNNDWLMAEYLISRVVEALPIVALPTLPWHYYPAFVEYPGSVNLSLSTSRAVVVDICRSLSHFGPRRFYVLNTGVSTDKPLALSQSDLAADGIVLRYTRLLDVLRPIEAEVARQEGGTHADECETSMMLYIAPHVVDMARAVRDYHPSRGPGPLTRDPKRGTGVYSPSGAWGDPTLATVEKGRCLVEGLLDHVVADIQGMLNL